MTAFGRWLRARADDVAVALLAVLFLTFVLQIVSRYVLRDPLGWTVELCLTLWLWTVFWGSAFCLGDRDHVRFEILYLAGGRRVRRVLALVSAIALVVGFVAALPPTWDYVTFYRIKRSGTLGIRLDYVFGIYLVFAVAIVARYALRALALVRGETPEIAAEEPGSASTVEPDERRDA